MVGPLFVSNAKGGIGRAVDGVRRAARNTSTHLGEQMGNVKEVAQGTVDKMTAKKPSPYEEAIAAYNIAYTSMSDKGLSLLRQRERSTDLIEHVELLMNSLANTPESFGADFDEIEMHRERFLEAEELAQRELEAARQSATGAGAGFVAGAAVASVAPTAAIWVATTFGTASTGTAISTLSGAAASQAALAWLGGGALVAGGGGTAAGSALLALAGPIGWTIAGATLLASIVLFTTKKFENREARQEALIQVKRNTALVEAKAARIDDLLRKTTSLREALVTYYGEALAHFGADFLTLSPAERLKLASLVINTRSCATLLSKRI